jgi:hypothetical protein
LANTPGEHIPEHTPEATLYECGGMEYADLFLMSGEHTPEATLYEYGGLENADLVLMSGEHTPEATLHEYGGLKNAEIVLMSGPASWCFPIPKRFYMRYPPMNKDQVESGPVFKIRR